MTCIECNTAKPIRDNVLLCEDCLRKILKAEQAKRKNCEKCGKKCNKGRFCFKCLVKIEDEEKKAKLLERQKIYNNLCVRCNQPTYSFKNECNRCFVIRYYESKDQKPTVDFGFVPTSPWTRKECYLWILNKEKRGWMVTPRELFCDLPHIAESLSLIRPETSGLGNSSKWLEAIWKSVFGWYQINKEKYGDNKLKS